MSSPPPQPSVCSPLPPSPPSQYNGISLCPSGSVVLAEVGCRDWSPKGDILRQLTAAKSRHGAMDEKPPRIQSCFWNLRPNASEIRNPSSPGDALCRGAMERSGREFLSRL